jgi:hypothetical protein
MLSGFFFTCSGIKNAPLMEMYEHYTTGAGKKSRCKPFFSGKCCGKGTNRPGLAAAKKDFRRPERGLRK